MKAEIKRFKLDDELIGKSVCIGDLYNKLGVNTYLNGNNMHADSIHACKKTNDYLYDTFIKNSKKDKRLKHYRSKYKESVVSMDFLMFAPRTNEDIPFMELVLYKEDDKQN